jgi:hypothetical protein
MLRSFRSKNRKSKTPKSGKKTKRKLHKKMRLWIDSSKAAREELGLGGKGQKFVPVGGKTREGKQLYRTTKQIFETAKLRGKLPASYHKIPKRRRTNKNRKISRSKSRWDKISRSRSR